MTMQADSARAPVVAQASTMDAAVLRQAELTPHAVAVVDGRHELTYAELVNWATASAHQLTRQGVVRGTVVGLLMGNSACYVATALAVLMAGGTYLPLDRRYPDQRLRWMAEDSGSSMVLTDGPTTGPDQIPGVPLRTAQEQPAQSALAADLPESPHTADDVAYIMYTSGSTGSPKGVAATHYNLVDFLGDPHWASEHHERVLAYSPLTFDSSTYELWVPLTHGGSAVVWAPDRLDATELGSALRQQKVTAAYFTTALFDTLASEDASVLGSLREVITGGDVLSETALKRVLGSCPQTAVVHAYGPTEATVFCSLQVFPAGWKGSTALHLGSPMAHTELHVRTDHLEPVQPGERGELCISGARVAQGYWRRPDLTAQSFVTDPCGPPGRPLYRTGDQAVRYADGTVGFAGRLDRQVKLRGFRIEPGEVEATLRKIPGIARAAVVIRDDLPGGRGLAGYVVPHSRDRAKDTDEIRSRLAELLPHYLIPAVLTTVPDLPLTAHGKVDYSALPRPLDTQESASEDPDTSGGGPLEGRLRVLFAEILHGSPVDAHDNFFELGGHSLHAIRLASRLPELAGRDVKVRELFEHPTPAQLATHLAEAHGGLGDTDSPEAR